MKVKFKKGSASKGAQLVITSEKSDELRYAESQDVQSGAGEALLSFGYEKCRNGRHRFSYYLNNQEPLESALKRVVPAEHFYCMLVSFVSLAKACESRASLSLKRVCFDVDYIFCDTRRGGLSFAYVPLQTAKPLPFGPLDALVYILEHIQTDKPYAQQTVRINLLDYVRGCNGIFSQIDFKARLVSLNVIAEEGNALPPLPELDPRTGPVDARCDFGYDFVREQGRLARDTPDGSLSQGGSPIAARYALALHDGTVKWQLAAGECVVGRSADCDISIDGIEGLSRRHARLVVEGGCCFVEDLGSVNGTAVNGRRLKKGERLRMHVGDTLQLATGVFMLKEGA